MKDNSTQLHTQEPAFDLVRLGRSKRAVDLSPNTIRGYAGAGLRLYRCGKAVFFSRTELIEFIKTRAMVAHAE
jgi:hypothetical protein